MKRIFLNPPDIINPTEKVCYKCHIKKLIINFNKCKNGIYGYHNHCRECSKINKANWDKNNSDWIKQYGKQPEIREKARNNLRNKYINNSDWRKKSLEKNRLRRRLEPAKIKARIQRKNWYLIPQNRIATSLRVRIYQALKECIKEKTTEQLTGCSFEYLKSHLENLFKPGMTWDNYGEWEIDHILPCVSFDLTITANQEKCFHYSNLQPLWGIENRSKGAKI